MTKEIKSWFTRINQNNPRIIIFGLMFIILIFVVGIMQSGHDKTTKILTEQYEREVVENTKLKEEYKLSRETWRQKEEKLKKKLKIVRVVKPDGTIHETTEEELESDTSITEQIKEEFELKIQQERENIEKTLTTKFEKLIKEKKKLSIGLGVGGNPDQFEDYYKYLHLDYNFYGPFSIQGGVNTKKEVLLGVGFSF